MRIARKIPGKRTALSFRSRLNLLLAHNRQKDDTERKQSFSDVANLTGSPSRSVFVDVNRVLPNPNGPGTIPNPNFEKMFILFAPMYSPGGHDTQNWRGQLVYDARPPWGITQRLVGGLILPAREILFRCVRMLADAGGNRPPRLHRRRRLLQQQPRFTDPLPGARRWRTDG